MTSPARVRGLYAIADTAYLPPARLLAAAEAALRGGARVLQYRDKGSDAERRAADAAALGALCRRYGALFIVNDDIDLARRASADGVHIGHDDAPLDAARVRAERMLLGVSCYNDLDRALAAVARGADYVAFGSFFPSRTKPQAVRAAPSLLRAAKTRLAVPLVAIGGVTPENGASLIEAGADALAVISGLFAEDDVEAAARRYAGLFGQA